MSPVNASISSTGLISGNYYETRSSVTEYTLDVGTGTVDESFIDLYERVLGDDAPVDAGDNPLVSLLISDSWSKEHNLIFGTNAKHLWDMPVPVFSVENTGHVHMNVRSRQVTQLGHSNTVEYVALDQRICAHSQHIRLSGCMPLNYDVPLKFTAPFHDLNNMMAVYREWDESQHYYFRKTPAVLRPMDFNHLVVPMVGWCRTSNNLVPLFLKGFLYYAMSMDAPHIPNGAWRSLDFEPAEWRPVFHSYVQQAGVSAEHDPPTWGPNIYQWVSGCRFCYARPSPISNVEMAMLCYMVAPFPQAGLVYGDNAAPAASDVPTRVHVAMNVRISGQSPRTIDFLNDRLATAFGLAAPTTTDVDPWRDAIVAVKDIGPHAWMTFMNHLAVEHGAFDQLYWAWTIARGLLFMYPPRNRTDYDPPLNRPDEGPEAADGHTFWRRRISDVFNYEGYFIPRPQLYRSFAFGVTMPNPDAQRKYREWFARFYTRSHFSFQSEINVYGRAYVYSRGMWANARCLTGGAQYYSGSVAPAHCPYTLSEGQRRHVMRVGIQRRIGNNKLSYFERNTLSSMFLMFGFSMNVSAMLIMAPDTSTNNNWACGNIKPYIDTVYAPVASASVADIISTWCSLAVGAPLNKHYTNVAGFYFDNLESGVQRTASSPSCGVSSYNLCDKNNPAANWFVNAAYTMGRRETTCTVKFSSIDGYGNPATAFQASTQVGEDAVLKYGLREGSLLSFDATLKRQRIFHVIFPQPINICLAEVGVHEIFQMKIEVPRNRKRMQIFRNLNS